MNLTFITTMAAQPWGGSEELWSQAALALTAQGRIVDACYPLLRGGSSRLEDLQKAGIPVYGYGFKNSKLNQWGGAIRAKLGGKTGYVPYPAPGNWRNADLVVVSQGGICDGLAWIENLANLRIPFAIICQANMVAFWPDDALSERLRTAYAAAKRVYFVSEDNLRLFRIQTGYLTDNAEVVWNPLQSGTQAEPLRWPTGEYPPLKLALVGRMEPFAKGQDLVLEALAQPVLRAVPITVNFYCHGPWADTCLRIIDQLRLETVRINPFATPAEIWASNHALLLPSRHEGMSLAMLEAMWLGRPVIATAVAGALSEVVDGRNGFLIPGPSTALVADGMLRAWELRHHLEAMGKNAAEMLRQRMPANPGNTLAQAIVSLC